MCACVRVCDIVICSCTLYALCHMVVIHCMFVTYACRDGGKFKRIAVFRGPLGGYGFADPYEFDSLLSLVVYYSTNTMEKHNPGLKAMLTFPAFHVNK